MACDRACTKGVCTPCTSNRCSLGSDAPPCAVRERRRLVVLDRRADMSAKSRGMKRVAMWATTLYRRRSKKWIRTVTFLMSTRRWTHQRRRPAWPSQVILTRLALGTCCLPMRLMSDMSRSIGGGGGVSCESMRHHTRMPPSQMSMRRRVLKMRWIWLSWYFCRTVCWSCSTSRRRRRNW